MITPNYIELKNRFLDRVKLQYKTIKKAFLDMDRHRESAITLKTFKEILESWSFVARETDIKLLFQWLDVDQDEKITMADFKKRLGFEITP